jgi:hypothetical protein
MKRNPRLRRREKVDKRRGVRNHFAARNPEKEPRKGVGSLFFCTPDGVRTISRRVIGQVFITLGYIKGETTCEKGKMRQPGTKKYCET